MFSTNQCRLMFKYISPRVYLCTRVIWQGLASTSSKATRPEWPPISPQRFYATRSTTSSKEQPEKHAADELHALGDGPIVSGSIRQLLNDYDDEESKPAKHVFKKYQNQEEKLKARAARKQKRREKLRPNRALQKMPKYEKMLKIDSLMETFDKYKTSDDPEFMPGSKHHHDLPSFLEYAARTELSESSTVFVGTHYEYTVAQALQPYKFDLMRVGRRGDAGVDLIGRWTVPSSEKPLKVFVQCKAGKGINGSHVRGLTGAFIGLPHYFRHNVLGLLAVSGKPTPGVRAAIDQSNFALGLLKVTQEGRLEHFYWNQAAVANGLQDMGVAIKYGARYGSFGPPKDHEVGLIFGGWPISNKEKAYIESNKAGALEP